MQGEGISFRKPGGPTSEIIDSRKDIPGSGISRLLPFFATPIILIDVKHSKKGLLICGVFCMFDQ